MTTRIVSLAVDIITIAIRYRSRDAHACCSKSQSLLSRCNLWKTGAAIGNVTKVVQYAFAGKPLILIFVTNIAKEV